MSAAVFGTEVDGRQSVILKFGKKAQWIPMVSGLITLAHNAGFMIDAHVVRQKDSIHVSLGDGATINHDPAMGQGRGNDNPVTAAYAMAWPIGHKADRIFEYLELPDIIARRDRSSSYRSSPNTSPWTNDFPAMARKSAVRALANHLPWQVQKADVLEGRHDRGENTWAEKVPDGSVNIEGEILDGDGGDGS
jgi:recombinational DNA repair protein RecT